MKGKLYFETLESEICFSKDYFTSNLKKGETIEVYEACKYTKHDRIKGVFWCYEHQFCGDYSQNTCGKICKEYQPRNGKSRSEERRVGKECRYRWSPEH